MIKIGMKKKFEIIVYNRKFLLFYFIFINLIIWEKNKVIGYYL